MININIAIEENENEKVSLEINSYGYRISPLEKILMEKIIDNTKGIKIKKIINN